MKTVAALFDCDGTLYSAQFGRGLLKYALSYQSVRLPPEQIELDEALAQLAAVMGETERDNAMAEGAKMSLDEAVELALALV